jgi:uncharacterized protein (DUF1697 family)
MDMAERMQTHVILLRAIGPATHRLMTMSQWREAAENHGFANPETLVNTGNMVATFKGGRVAAGQTMTTILRGFGLGDNVVPIIRSPAQMLRLAKTDLLQAEERSAETAVFFCLDAKPDFEWLRNYDGPEHVDIIEHHLVVDFVHGSTKAGRLLRLIDKHCGVNTARNGNSVHRIAERCRTRAASHRQK